MNYRVAMEDRIIAPNIKFLLDSKLRTMPSIMETLAEKACIEVKILSRKKINQEIWSLQKNGNNLRSWLWFSKQMWLENLFKQMEPQSLSWHTVARTHSNQTRDGLRSDFSVKFKICWRIADFVWFWNQPTQWVVASTNIKYFSFTIYLW